jgi:trimethylamine--corrinoid protein Co-methyltransferase
VTQRDPLAGEAIGGGFGPAPMSAAGFRQIHLATLEVLERTGFWVEDDEALDLYADGGCFVDRGSRVVRARPETVEDAIAAAPERIVLYGRGNPEHDVVLEPGRVGFTNFSEGLQFVDPHTGVRRDATKADLAGIARMADCLSEIDTFGVAVGAHDVPTETAAVHNAEAQLLNTTKPVDAGPLSRRDVIDIAAMAAAIAGGEDALRERPTLFMGVCPVSPLKMPREASEVTIELARRGIANNILSMAMSGASSPVTPAGTLVVHNAEVLAGLLLAQFAERGAPVIYGSSTTAMDLRLASASVGSPECAMISAAVAFMAKQYRLPSFVAGA